MSQTPHAFDRLKQWSQRDEEFVKRAAFALLASLALHAKSASDDAFLACLPLIERGAHDDRNFVKKSVSWALRGIGARRPSLRGEAILLAEELAASADKGARWVGKDALCELQRR